MPSITIATVTQKEVPLLDGALRQLAADLGDDYLADQADLGAAVCGPGAGCFALIARQNNTPLGVALAAPIFSTSRGGAGVFVSDLWVAEPARGQGLARRLLASTLQEGTRRNAGHFLKLTVYRTNLRAIATYERLGFTASAGETNMFLTGPSLETLRETA